MRIRSAGHLTSYFDNLEEEVGSYAHDIWRRLADGPIRATHDNLPAALKLSGCNRVQLNAALAQLEESGKIWVNRSPTHTHLGRRPKKRRS